MILLGAEAIEKSFGVQVVLDQVDLSIDQRERLGLVGANGVGKSSLAKILARCRRADRPEFDAQGIRLAKRQRIRSWLRSRRSPPNSRM